jgi:hypothetical protein
LPEFLILVILAFAVATSLNPRPWIVPFGFSSVYKSECLSEPAGWPFFLGILGASSNDFKSYNHAFLIRPSVSYET